MEQLFESSPGGFLHTVLLPFADILNEHMNEFQRAVDASDVEAARAVTHTIKGAARNLGFTTLGYLAENVEADTKRGSMQAAVEALPAIMAEVHAIHAYIQSYNQS